jgi:ABC-type dipeptide/oligopeptide/nickel transport system permease subunit
MFGYILLILAFVSFISFLGLAYTGSDRWAQICLGSMISLIVGLIVVLVGQMINV